MYELAINFPDGSTTCSSDCDNYANGFWSDRRQSAQSCSHWRSPHPLPLPSSQHMHICALLCTITISLVQMGWSVAKSAGTVYPTDILRRRKSAERTWLKTLTDVVCFCCFANVRSLLFLSQKLGKSWPDKQLPPSTCTARHAHIYPTDSVYVVYQKVSRRVGSNHRQDEKQVPRY